ncbi:MAG TPA: hypothetical protein VHE57_07395 [Mycobacteriales bacterium]|nr:hypothetical protein [Mycobacteriales bacterium]
MKRSAFVAGTAIVATVLAGTATATAVATSRPQVSGVQARHAHATKATATTVDVSSFATQPVVLTGADFPAWSGGPELTARVPQPPNYYGVANTQQYLPRSLRSDCYQDKPKPDVNGYVDRFHNDHSCFQSSQLPVRTLRDGVPTGSLRGYAWTGKRFTQIPFQVDPMWNHYLSNNASGFAVYSGTDEFLTYQFDEEPFLRYTNPPLPERCHAGKGAVTPGCIPPGPHQLEQAAVVCKAIAPKGTPDPTPDPNAGLINSDQLSFMARDAGPAAPPTAKLPRGIVSANQVLVVDPSTGKTRYAYVMQSAPKGKGWAVPPRYTVKNSPYVRYTPDRDANTLVYSRSSYSDYGNARYGPVCTPDGRAVIGQGFRYNAHHDVVLDPKTYQQRRTIDNATVETPRYRFRFDGRWVMDSLRVSKNDKGLTRGNYGPSIVDRFKARAFQQSPGGQTPCCGYEDEQNNWGGSSITMGIRQGPVRDIRVTWGSDSGTNVTRTDIFYAYTMVHDFGIRVHPIPPLDGIYSQWDMAAGAITRYYNPYNPKGVPVTGINPVLYGDTNVHVGPDGVSESSNDKLGRIQERLTGGKPITIGNPNNETCDSDACVYDSVNLPDVTFSGVAPNLLGWEEMTGPAGTMVEKWGLSQNQPLSAGDAQGVLVAVPYYVDDSCFDDGTGANPGPHVQLRSADEPTTWGFADVDGQPVAQTPAPAPADRFHGKVHAGGHTYEGTRTYQRRCWNHHADGTPYNIRGTVTFDPSKPAQHPDPAPDRHFGPQGDVRYLQGDVATHGQHMLLIAESDNATLTTAVDEIDAADNQLILPPGVGNVGAAAARAYLLPITLAVVTPFVGR